MDYKKKYNEAMLRADEAVQKGCLDKGIFDEIFPPEESEGERIRKEFVALIKEAEARGNYWHDLKVADILAWLEKQKETLHIQETCKENADSFTDKSEDERIRNCIRCLTSLDQAQDVIADMGFTRQDILAYLEKQKETLHIQKTCKENAEYFRRILCKMRR